MWVAAKSLSVLPHRWQGPSWEPSWEPFAVDDAGRPWTPMESKALNTRPNALLWTLMDAAWRSTDQEVGCSSRPGRARYNPQVRENFSRYPYGLNGQEMGHLFTICSRRADLASELVDFDDGRRLIPKERTLNFVKKSALPTRAHGIESGPTQKVLQPDPHQLDGNQRHRM